MFQEIQYLYQQLQQLSVNKCLWFKQRTKILNKDEEKYYLLYADYTFNRMCTEKFILKKRK
jgi:hypothetical protein